MEHLAVNAQGLVAQFFLNYQIWKDYKKFYFNDNSAPVIKCNQHGAPTFHVSDVDGINACHEKLILIDNLTEGLHSKNYFEKYDPGKQYLIFSNGLWSKNRYDISINHIVVNHLFFLFEMSDNYFSPRRFAFYLDKQYDFCYPKNCLFVSTIGNQKPPRDYFVNQLKKNINVEKFILRYSGQDFGIPSTQFEINNLDKEEFNPYINLLDQYFHNLSQTIPIDMYNQAYFNIVVETDIDYIDNFFLTEKTIKALATGIPFVVVSTPHFLKHLHYLGFTTYGELWDETYDSITDYRERINHIVSLCNKMTTFDWASSRYKLKEIAQKNQSAFLRLNQIANNEFENFEKIVRSL